MVEFVQDLERGCCDYSLLEDKATVFDVYRACRQGIAAPFFLCAAVGLIVLGQGRHLATLTLGAVMTGVGLGSEFSVMPLLLSRYLGLRAMGAITRVDYATALLSNAIAPLALNRVFDVSGSYAPALKLLAAMMLCNAAVFFIMKRFPTSWKI